MALPTEHAIAHGASLLVVSRAEGPWHGWLEGSEIRAVISGDHQQVLHALRAGAIDAVLIDLQEGEAPPAELLDALLREHAGTPVIVAAHGMAAPLHPAMRILIKPLSRDTLLHEVRAALLLSYSSDDADGVAPALETRLLGSSRAMQRVRDLIARAGPGMATILIRGETGTGKELVARAIHQASDRAAGPLVTIHCAALPDTLLESELFGHARGAFTGATEAKLGRVALAAGGTLFLDEIGDITLATQVKLLRLLQEREYQPLGTTRSLSADVRFVFATHRDLDAMVKEGTFREDLFYRLQVVPIWVPPLRARGDDVRELAETFCLTFAQRNNRAQIALSEGALARLRDARWPGNVRQLQNFIERLVVLGQGGVIQAEDIDRELSDAAPFSTSSGGASATISVVSSRNPGRVEPLDVALRAAERKAIVKALHAARGNRSQAARLLGVSRATLYNKLKEHALP